jgi:hypothetical protein
MSKIKNKTNYWEEFYKNNQDTDLRKFVSEDPILIKVFNFASIPLILQDVNSILLMKR